MTPSSVTNVDSTSLLIVGSSSSGEICWRYDVCPPPNSSVQLNCEDGGVGIEHRLGHGDRQLAEGVRSEVVEDGGARGERQFLRLADHAHRAHLADPHAPNGDALVGPHQQLQVHGAVPAGARSVELPGVE